MQPLGCDRTASHAPFTLSLSKGLLFLPTEGSKNRASTRSDRTDFFDLEQA
jgi:hypothetical protein